MIRRVSDFQSLTVPDTVYLCVNCIILCLYKKYTYNLNTIFELLACIVVLRIMDHSTTRFRQNISFIYLVKIISFVRQHFQLDLKL